MITENRSLVDAHPVHYFRRHLIRSQIDVVFLKSEIIPHHILRLEEVFVFKILHLQPHCGEMIPVHYQYDVFRIIFKSGYQLAYKLVHLMDLVDIVFPLIVLLLCGRAGNCDLRILEDRFFRVGPVPLHGDGVYIIRLILCGIQTLDDLIRKDTVPGPSKRVFVVLLRHVFRGSEGVKSKIRENTLSAVEVCLIVMYGMSRIAKIFQDIRRALAGGLLEDTLIGIFPGAEIMHAHSRYGLELCVRRSGSHGRNLVITRRIFLHQFPEIGDRIIGNIQVVYQFRIKERFQLDEYDIRKILCLRLGKIGFRFFNAGDLLLRIVPGTADSGVKYGCRQTIGISVILIGKSNVSKVIGKHPFFQRQLGDPSESGHAGQNQRKVVSVFQFAFISWPFDQKDQKDQGKNTQYDQRNRHAPCRKVFLQKGHAVCQESQVRPGKRSDAVSQDHSVNDSQKEPEHCQQHPQETSSAEQIYDQRCRENKCCIVGKYQRLFCHVYPGFRQ